MVVRANFEESCMTSSRVHSLQGKHANIEAKLHDEMLRPFPNEAMLRQLKKEKLRIKEELVSELEQV